VNKKARITELAEVPGVVMDVWFVGQSEPRRYTFKTEDFKRFEIANREWMGSNRPGAEFGLDEEGKMVFIRLDQIVRREIISIVEARPMRNF
jgi:hypothetical protein